MSKRPLCNCYKGRTLSASSFDRKQFLTLKTQFFLMSQQLRSSVHDCLVYLILGSYTTQSCFLWDLHIKPVSRCGPSYRLHFSESRAGNLTYSSCEYPFCTLKGESFIRRPQFVTNTGTLWYWSYLGLCSSCYSALLLSLQQFGVCCQSFLVFCLGEWSCATDLPC